MHTIRSETRSISIPAPPDAVLDVVGDARLLPLWAPAFTTTVERDGEHWVIDGGGRIDVRVSRESGTVDIVSAEDPRRGAFSRVLPNAAGSEFLFTLFFADHDDAAVARQMEIVEQELRAVSELAQAAR